MWKRLHKSYDPLYSEGCGGWVKSISVFRERSSFFSYIALPWVSDPEDMYSSTALLWSKNKMKVMKDLKYDLHWNHRQLLFYAVAGTPEQARPAKPQSGLDFPDLGLSILPKNEKKSLSWVKNKLRTSEHCLFLEDLWTPKIAYEIYWRLHQSNWLSLQ